MTSRPAKILALLIVLSALTGAYSVHLGVSQMWDIKNYHLYNPFALVGWRYLTDVAPAQLQTFFNPAVDLPFFALISLWNDQPRVVAFLMGASHGINLLCVTLIAWHLLGTLATLSTAARAMLTAIAVLIGATGAGSMPLIGVATGDLQAPIPMFLALVLGIYACDRAGTDPDAALRLATLSGLFAGLAVGLKLTMALYGIALAASLLALPGSLRSWAGLRFVAAGAVGALASGGLHHLTMWRLFGNPIFPLANNLFRSPYAEPLPFADVRFLPKSWVDWLFYPFEWAQHGAPGMVSELAFRDIRIAMAISLGALVLLTRFLSRLNRGQEAPRATPPGIRALIIFMIVAYLLWLGLFSIYRYLLPIELLSGVVIVLAIGSLVNREAWPVVAGAAAALCIATTIPLEWGHARFNKRYVEVTAPQLDPNTLVVIVGRDPVSYFIPFLDPNIRWVSVDNSLVQLGQRNLLVARARDLIHAHRKPLMALQAGVKDDDFARTLAQLSLVPRAETCASLSSNLGPEQYRLCPIELRATERGSP
jgi:hypothetical protein